MKLCIVFFITTLITMVLSATQPTKVIEGGFVSLADYAPSYDEYNLQQLNSETIPWKFQYLDADSLYRNAMELDDYMYDYGYNDRLYYEGFSGYNVYLYYPQFYSDKVDSGTNRLDEVLDTIGKLTNISDNNFSDMVMNDLAQQPDGEFFKRYEIGDLTFCILRDKSNSSSYLTEASEIYAIILEADIIAEPYKSINERVQTDGFFVEEIYTGSEKTSMIYTNLLSHLDMNVMLEIDENGVVDQVNFHIGYLDSNNLPLSISQQDMIYSALDEIDASQFYSVTLFMINEILVDGNVPQRFSEGVLTSPEGNNDYQIQMGADNGASTDRYFRLSISK